MTPPVNELGNAFRKCDGGWADPDCIRCEGTGEVGYGSERECCECVVDDVNLMSDADHCPPRVEAM